MSLKFILPLLLICLCGTVQSQETSQKTPLRVGIFISLYLDSTFTNDTAYNYDMQMPRHILSGLDFAEGALIGLDTIVTSDAEVLFYDLKSKNQTIEALRSSNSFDSLDLIIGAVSGNEYRSLSEMASERHIPFLSATFPNDGGISGNPFTILLNPTIGVHCQAIARFVQQTFPTGNVIYFRKTGLQEDKIYQNLYLFHQKQYPKSKTRWSSYIPSDSMDIAEIESLLDTARQNILICGSLEEKFNTDFLAMTSVLRQNNLHLMGMPNWETLKELQQNKHKSKTCYYSTSFFNDGSQPFISFQEKFTGKTNGKPSDIAYRGYDAAYYFINLLLKHRNNFINQLNDTSFVQLIDYQILPVKNTPQSQPEYFENKRIYIIRRSQGTNTKVGKF
jgi:hypothetical protein